MNERMFPFITQTWNPLGGSCEHDCEYCWVPILKHKFPFVNLKYGGPSKLYTKELAKVKQFAASDFVFVCDCTDLFGSWVPKEYIQLILDAVETSPAQFLLLTKNPIRYQEFKLPNNCVAGVTIETSLENNLQNAPKREDRWLAMVNLKHPRKMISVEPIMKFDYHLHDWLESIGPEFVAIGYDNYNHGLPEPTLAETEHLIKMLELNEKKVYRKTIREAASL